MHIFYEAVIIGIITLIIGKIGFYLSSSQDDKNKKEVSNIILFSIGFILHFFIDFIGLDKWYCDKCDKCTLPLSM